MNKLIGNIRNKYTDLQIIVGSGLILRIVAAIFSKGFGWFDDHFLIIEAAQSWVDGYDYNYWLPDPHFPDRQPQGHPMFYTGLHYLIFKLFAFLGIGDPQFKMTIVRLLHAFFSMIIVTYGYKIAEHYSNKKIALYAATFLSLYWFMPFLSVRNLAEFVCVPPLFIATWLLIKEKNIKNYLFAGIWIGIAFSARFQSLFYSAGIVIALFIYRTELKYLLSCAFGFFITIGITQGLLDYFIWGRGFAEFSAYVDYNLHNAELYGNNIWHMYFDLILGLLIPPLSFLLFGGWFVNWKKIPILFWPVFIYLAFHIYFPNKQERFVLTIIPTLILSGAIGMFILYEKYKAKVKPGLFKFSKNFVIIVNCFLLIVFCFTYSKRNRCEAMYYLYKQPDLKMAMVDDSNKENDFTMPPLFYLGKWYSVYGITKTFTPDSVVETFKHIPDSVKPNYIVFWQAENIETRVADFKKRFPKTTYVITIEPGLIDKTLKWLNPINDNQTTYIYKINE
jgi:hypothetical protein